METAITTYKSAALPSPSEWNTIANMADALVRSGLLPAHIKSPQAAIAIIQKGRELGVPPMYALSKIAVVQGNPTCAAEMMLALVYRDHGDNALIIEETTDTVCRVSARRRGWDKRRELSFSIREAEQAGLLKNPVWKQYPNAMLRARAISAAARAYFPDSIAGMYTPEEVGLPVTVTSEGEVVAAPIEEAAPANGATPPPVPEPPSVSPSMVRDAQALCSRKGLSARQVGELLAPFGVDKVAQLTKDAYYEFVRVVDELPDAG